METVAAQAVRRTSELRKMRKELKPLVGLMYDSLKSETQFTELAATYGMGPPKGAVNRLVTDLNTVLEY